MDIQFVREEADAGLAILDQQACGIQATDADWQALFSREVYISKKSIKGELGRAIVIEAFGDPRNLLAFYNRAADIKYPRWHHYE